MEEYDFRFQPLTLAVVSTFGNGDAPENGQQFIKTVASSVNTDSLQGSR